jgi:hypothetical protein
MTTIHSIIVVLFLIVLYLIIWDVIGAGSMASAVIAGLLVNVILALLWWVL